MKRLPFEHICSWILFLFLLKSVVFCVELLALTLNMFCLMLFFYIFIYLYFTGINLFYMSKGQILQN